MVEDERLLRDLEKLHNWAKEQCENTNIDYEVPTMRMMDKFGSWSANTYVRNFGSWNEAIMESDIDGCSNKNQSISETDLIEEIHRLKEELGRVPTTEDMNDKGSYSSGTFRKLGGWNKSLMIAGLEPNQIETDREKLMSEIQSVAEEIGGTPSISDVEEHGKWSQKSYQDYFGSWNEALRSAGFDPIREYPIEPEWDNDLDDYYGDSWHEKRKKALERDDNTCMACGSEERLQVHHIKPRRKFKDPDNSNFLDNLVTLCISCHGRFEGRWTECNYDEFVSNVSDIGVTND